jgi:malonate-semialdehyde dehydrogenase (acetylating)/methylmalonate-semialdehyde dehydrogenase
MPSPQPYTDAADIGHWIQGGVQRGTGTRSQTVWNPATGTAARRVQIGRAHV